jgi:hypothetical protein
VHVYSAAARGSWRQLRARLGERDQGFSQQSVGRIFDHLALEQCRAPRAWNRLDTLDRTRQLPAHRSDHIGITTLVDHL